MGEKTSTGKYSLLYPYGMEGYHKINDVTLHDLGFDQIVKNISGKENEQLLILRIMANMNPDPKVSEYRIAVFDDIFHNKKMREDLLKILDKINFLKEYGSFKKNSEDVASAWVLIHRLAEISDYIEAVDSIYKCLSGAEIHSEGLIGLKDYVSRLFNEKGFEELRKDINDLKATTGNLRSVTLGVNLNGVYEASEVGIVSLNNKPFTKAGVISNFSTFLNTKDKLKDTTEWKDNYKFHQVTSEDAGAVVSDRDIETVGLGLKNQVAAATMAGVPDGDVGSNTIQYMDRILGHMMALSVRRLREILNKYVFITITDITDLIPELMYYVRWAEYLEKLENKGYKFCRAKATTDGLKTCARGIYNFKLAAFPAAEHEEIVPNDLDFDTDHCVYLLTGANRGGKTTITQAIGQLFVLAQGGIYVPGESVSFVPVDAIYTHFPADEDKTMDLGRLGEECKRFKDIYSACTDKSLLLLNETFSTTSFEEGYYIARDAVRAILNKGTRTIYNTHMHKLALEISKLNEESTAAKAQSLIVCSEEGKRSYKIKVAEPVGQSFAQDIAVKYGVTYEMLTAK